MYYLKKLGRQELGSVNANGIPQRGRYIYISKSENVLHFFPPLSTTDLNDCALIPIIPLYLNKKVYCNYVYHNDRVIDPNGTRNEYRLYLNRELEDNVWLFQEGDIVLLKKDQLQTDTQEVQTVYFLDLITPTDNLYNRCNNLIAEYPIRGGHAIYRDTLPEIEARIQNIKDGNNANNLDIIIAPEVTKKILHNTKVSDLFNPNSFRDFVMVGYNNKCAITGSVIQYGNYTNLEAAHIRPRSHGGVYLPSNGIAMCRDMHWAFDKGFFCIQDDGTITVHPGIESELLYSYNNKQIFMPNDDFFKPKPEFLKYHRDNVFGLFQTSGRL